MNGLKEARAHGDIFLPVNCYHCSIPDGYTFLAPHWHEEMEITLIRKGCSDYRIYTESFTANEGDILIVPPRCIHSSREIPGNVMVSDSLVFHLDFLGAEGKDILATRFLQPLRKGVYGAEVVIHPEDPGYERILQAFEISLTSFTEKVPFYELKLKTGLLMMITALFEEQYVGGARHSDSELTNRSQINDLITYMNQNYTKKLTVEELAKRVGFSESHFMYYFKSKVGMTCLEYLISYRLEQAALALLEGDCPVLEIAMNHGFDNVSYFNRQFRKRFGMTPTRFRKKKQDEEQEGTKE